MVSGKTGQSLMMSGVEQQLAQHKEEIDRLREIVINDGGPNTHQARLIGLETKVDAIEKRHKRIDYWLAGITGGIVIELILRFLHIR